MTAATARAPEAATKPVVVIIVNFHPVSIHALYKQPPFLEADVDDRENPTGTDLLSSHLIIIDRVNADKTRNRFDKRVSGRPEGRPGFRRRHSDEPNGDSSNLTEPRGLLL